MEHGSNQENGHKDFYGKPIDVVYDFDHPEFWHYQRDLQNKYKKLWLKHEITKGDYEYRNIDGTYNNKDEPYKGSAGVHLIRYAPADYLQDGYTPAADETRPSPREISNEIFAQYDPIPNEHYASGMFWLWGQFIDHDIDLTPDSSGESYNIKIPKGDPYFDPLGEGDKEMSLHRSEYDPETGKDGVQREQVNKITSYLDASMVYGSDKERADYLRTFEHGKMKTSEHDLLPFNEDGLENAGGTDSSLFIAGDIRANENIALTAMHTLFVREHNHWANKIYEWDPYLSDEEIYQKAKMIVTAEIQSITYNEFLPLLLGKDAIPKYHGYDHNVNPEVANIFSTAAYRLGHTLLNSTIFRLDEDGNPIAEGNLELRDAFFAPEKIVEQGEIASIMRGFAFAHAETLDAQIIDEVRNFLFGPPGSGGFDLASLNIQRGRDHGLPDYNTAREAYGLPKVNSFDEITSDPVLQAKLSALYGHVDNIDVFVGGLCEDHKDGSMMGELFHAIVLDQFVRMRDGDRHWYKNELPEKMVEMIEETKLSDIIIRNTEVEYMQHDAMISYDRIAGAYEDDVMDGDHHHDLLVALDGKDLIKGHDGHDSIWGGKGKDTIHGGKGDDHMHGGKGKDHFVFHKGSGHDVIKDFHPGKDKIDLKDYHLTEADLFLETYKVGDNTVIHMSPYSSITLENISPIELQHGDFLI